MSTNVTVAVAAPNHLPVDVTVQDRRKSGKKDVWVDNEFDGGRLPVGAAKTFLVHAGRRVIIEEVAS